MRYTRRFAPFAAVNFPQIVPYQSYVEAVGLKNKTPPFVVIDFLQQSYGNFETARKIIEAADMLKTSAEAGVLLNIAKNNMVVTKILAESMRKEVARSVKFDFSLHKIYPMVKFV